MTAASLVSSVVDKVGSMTKVQPVRDGSALLAQLTARAGKLRDVASLEASHEELQQAAKEGQLVAWRQCKVRDDAGGQRVFSPGEALPPLDVQHRLLTPGERYVTTRARWTAKQEYLRLSDYLQREQLPTVKAKLRQATAKREALTTEIARLQTALATARQELRQAEAEFSAADAELRSFVANAPL